MKFMYTKLLSAGVACLALLAGRVEAQCSTINLRTPWNTALTSHQVFPVNNTICRFGGDYAGVLGVVSCLSLSVAITPQNQIGYQSLLATLEAQQPLTSGQISQISSNVDYAFFGKQDTTTAQAVEFAFVNKANLMDWANNGYPPAPTYGRGTYYLIHGGQGVRRVGFSPVVRPSYLTPDITTEFMSASGFLGIVGYDKANPSARMAIYRIGSAAAIHNFDPITVCTGTAATSATDYFHRYAETAAPMTSLSSGRRIIHVD
ncbi:MAG: hypothetical protein K1X79_10225 [Oligoflexia bacterium]|nr:hypothetical protein [Oligoflexia bacterium]